MKRSALVVIAVAALLASPASAQDSPLATFVKHHEALKKRTQDWGSPDSPFGQLSKASREWIKAETRRQIDAPRPTLEVAVAIDSALEADNLKLSRRHRMDPQDITRAVLLMVMADAEDAAAKAAKRAKKAGEPLAAQAAAERLAQASANRKEAFEMQSDVSLALAMM